MLELGHGLGASLVWCLVQAYLLLIVARDCVLAAFAKHSFR
jgi:hypothetical protein